MSRENLQIQSFRNKLINVKKNPYFNLLYDIIHQSNASIMKL